MSDKWFPNIVGQKNPKKKLSFFLENRRTSGMFPNCLFVAPKGSGKSYFVEELGRCLHKANVKPKPLITLNCSHLKTCDQFFSEVVRPHVVDKEVTLFLDEASELAHPIVMALLTITNPNPKRKNIYTFDGSDYEFDFQKHTFIFATTEAQAIFYALTDRLERVELDEYTPDELGEIVWRGISAKPIKGVLEEVAGSLRGNARAAQKIGEHIDGYLKRSNKTTFDPNDWAIIRDSLGILPLGLSPIEMRVLKLLGERRKRSGGGYSLTQLSSLIDMAPEALRQDAEKYLLKHHLMFIETKGRKITNEGVKYLESALD
jgi:Holliday junction resolvasome RuvABC ATP-dependent DNA helicase subunit